MSFVKYFDDDFTYDFNDGFKDFNYDDLMMNSTFFARICQKQHERSNICHLDPTSPFNQTDIDGSACCGSTRKCNPVFRE